MPALYLCLLMSLQGLRCVYLPPYLPPSIPLSLSFILSASLSLGLVVKYILGCLALPCREAGGAACGGFSLFELPFPTVFVVALPPANSPHATPCPISQAGDQLNAQLPPSQLQALYPPAPPCFHPLSLAALVYFTQIISNLFRVTCPPCHLRTCHTPYP